MATNPNNAVGTNGAFGGRTSVNAFNDALATYNDRGVLSGWTCLASSGMTVELGGISGRRDVAVAMDANGNFTTINNISGSPISVTLPAAPGTNKRIDVVVAYVDNPPQGTATDTDNPGACGIIPVSGTVAANPSMPNETTIRSAITADGASGSSAYYVVLAKITVASGTTDIDNTMIEAGQHAEIQGETVGTGAIADGAVTADKIDYATLAPNYTGAQNITSNSFSPTQFGWVVVNAVILSNTYGSRATVYVDGVRVWLSAQYVQGLQQYNIQGGGMIPVGPGNTVTFDVQDGASWDARRFIPAKTS